MDRIRRRHVLSTVLALGLAIESVAVVTAAAGGVLSLRHSAAHALPEATPAGAVLAAEGTSGRSWEPGAAATPTMITASDPRDYAQPKAIVVATPATAPKATAKVTARATTKPATTKAAAKAAATPRATPKVTPAKSAAYHGRNHVWIPSLGINRSLQFFPCDRAAPPNNYVYRWGCAGANNMYLMGHASSVFKPLHDAYLNGKLKVGMRVYYADAAGKVHVYAVRYWRLVRPTSDASWAWAAQASPSMTLQTCMGANSEYRLIVRLAQVG